MAVVTYQSFLQESFTQERVGEILSGRQYIRPQGEEGELFHLVGATPDYGLLFRTRSGLLTKNWESWATLGGDVFAYTFDFANFSPVVMPAGALHAEGADPILRGEEGSRKYVYGSAVSIDGGATWTVPSLPGYGGGHGYAVTVINDEFVAYQKFGGDGWMFATSSDGQNWTLHNPPGGLASTNGLGFAFGAGKAANGVYAIDSWGFIFYSSYWSEPFVSVPVPPELQISVDQDDTENTGPLWYEYQGRTFFAWSDRWSPSIDVYEISPTQFSKIFSTVDLDFWWGPSPSGVQYNRMTFQEGRFYWGLLGSAEVGSLGLTTVDDVVYYDISDQDSFCSNNEAVAALVSIPGNSRAPGGGAPPLPVIPPPFWRDHTVTYELP